MTSLMTVETDLMRWTAVRDEFDEIVVKNSKRLRLAVILKELSKINADMFRVTMTKLSNMILKK